MATYPSGTVTLVFTDIEGSTVLLRRLGERYGETLATHRRLLRESFARSGGHEVDTQGDSFFVAFARASDALEAAVEAQRRLAREPWPEGAEVRVRMGIHTGEPAVGDEGYLGLDVHRAARICAAAHGGQIMLSQTTRDLSTELLPPETELEDLGEHALKDMPRPERLFQLVGTGLPSGFPPLERGRQQDEAAPFVGREPELAVLLRQVLSAAGGRVTGTLSRRRAKHRGFADYGWEVRGLVASAPTGAQASLAAAGADLFTLGRTAVDVDRYLESADRRLVERRLKEYRELAVVSRRAGTEAEDLEGVLAQFDALVAQRAQLANVATEVEAAIGRVRRHVEDGDADAVRAEAEALRELVRPVERDVRARQEDVRRSLGDLGLVLKRTRHRGVFRLGNRYVVPFFNELGIEERRQFSSLEEAHAFRKSVRLAEAGDGEEWSEGTISGMRQWGAEKGIIPPRRDRR